MKLTCRNINTNSKQNLNMILKQFNNVRYLCRIPRYLCLQLNTYIM